MIGESRYVFSALKCIAQRRVYKGRLHYLPSYCKEADYQLSPASSSTAKDPPCENLAQASLGKTVAQDVFQAPVGGPPSADGKSKEHSDDDVSHPADRGKDNDRQADDITLVMEGMTDEVHKETTPSPKIEYISSSRAEVSTSNNSSSSPVLANQVQHLEADLLPDINDPVPDSWVTLEEDFTMIMPLMVPLFSNGLVGDSSMRIGSGELHIVYVTDISRSTLFSILVDSNFEREEMRTVRTRAFRIEPLSQEGLITIDGEPIEYGAIQGQLHRNMLRIFSRKRIANLC